MNYLTAILAVPVFVFLWLAELWVYRNCQFPEKHIQKIKACLVVSTLQMISCWFWLLGFVFSKTNSVLSEAKDSANGEEMNCVGLVGAEVLLATFQCIFTIVTISFTFVILSLKRRLVNHTASLERIRDPKGEGGKQIILLSIILATYTIIAYATAINRRCPQNTWKPLIQLQHHFYPVYLLFDSVCAVLTLMACKVLLKKFRVVSGKTRMIRSNTSGSGFARRVRKFANFCKVQCAVTLAGCVFSIGIFLLQFGLEVEAFSVIACVFCLCMYITYAIRRVSIIVLFSSR